MIYIPFILIRRSKENSYDLIGNSTTILWFVNNYFCLHIIICQQTNKSINLTLCQSLINKSLLRRKPKFYPEIRGSIVTDLPIFSVLVFIVFFESSLFTNSTDFELDGPKLLSKSASKSASLWMVKTDTLKWRDYCVCNFQRESNTQFQLTSSSLISCLISLLRSSSSKSTWISSTSLFRFCFLLVTDTMLSSPSISDLESKLLRLPRWLQINYLQIMKSEFEFKFFCM